MAAQATPHAASMPHACEQSERSAPIQRTRARVAAQAVESSERVRARQTRDSQQGTTRTHPTAVHPDPAGTYTAHAHRSTGPAGWNLADRRRATESLGPCTSLQVHTSTASSSARPLARAPLRRECHCTRPRRAGEAPSRAGVFSAARHTGRAPGCRPAPAGSEQVQVVCITRIQRRAQHQGAAPWQARASDASRTDVRGTSRRHRLPDSLSTTP